MQSRANPLEDTGWFYADEQPPKAVAAVVHGLNFRPSKMLDIVESLRDAGIDVLRVALTGHRGIPGEINKASRSVWLNDMAETHRMVTDRAREVDAPKYFVGYSLGGLLQVDLQQKYPHMHYDRMALFAPALSLQRKVYLLKALTAFMPRPWTIPSMSGMSDLLINRGLPAGVYHTLFNAQASVMRRGIPDTVGEIPTKIFVHPSDGLVSADGLNEIVRECPAWSMDRIDEIQSLARRCLFHLITDEESLGNTEWDRVTTTMKEHLLN